MKYFNHCYYINLKKRFDRKNHFLNKVIPFLNIKKNDYSRINAIDTTSENSISLRALGCTLSHLKTLEKAQSSNFHSVLILEDDFDPLVSSDTFYKYLHCLYTKHPDFNLCQISYNDEVGYDVTKGEPIDKSGYVLFSPNVQTTSGYIVKNSFISKILPAIEESAEQLKLGGSQKTWAIDVVWKKFQKRENKWYLLKRSGKQLEDFSDIEGMNVNYNC